MDQQISSLKEELQQTRLNSGSGTIAQASSSSAAKSLFIGRGSTLAKSPGKHFIETLPGPPSFWAAILIHQSPWDTERPGVTQYLTMQCSWTNLSRGRIRLQICGSKSLELVRSVRLYLTSRILSGMYHCRRMNYYHWHAQINIGKYAWIIVLIEGYQILAGLSNKRTPLLPSAGDIREIQYLAVCVPKQAHRDTVGE